VSAAKGLARNSSRTTRQRRPDVYNCVGPSNAQTGLFLSSCSAGSHSSLGRSVFLVRGAIWRRMAEISMEGRELAEPDPASLIESLRAFGYNLPTAIADLVDNSLTAGASRVDICFRWDGASSTVCITDNGAGMSKSRLVEALRPGSLNPLGQRDARDLGRFGLGLKTASFSQCRRLTVRTRTRGGDDTKRTWDLDHVGLSREWRLVEYDDPEADALLAGVESFDSGTTVLWQGCDRIVPAGTNPDDDRAQRRFLELADGVTHHLALVFHRFIDGLPPVKFRINGNVLKSFDPFLQREKSTQLAEETLKLHEQAVVVRPFVLPHHTKLTKDVYDRAGGPRGWTQSQGFYVYRNKRLLVDGDWLGLGLRKEDHYKLARIQVDIPNTLDSEWQIDVRKARATPPLPLRDRLFQIAQLTRTSASNVYRHRGARLRNPKQELVFLWERKLSHGKPRYELNRAHPAVARVVTGQCCTPRDVACLLKLIEETLPVPTITIDVAERPDEQREPFEHLDTTDLVVLGTELAKSMRESGATVGETVERLSSLEPFNRLPHVVQCVFEEIL
jgi:hypothetical protein